MTPLFWGGDGGGVIIEIQLAQYIFTGMWEISVPTYRYDLINQTQNINEYIQDSIPVPMYFAPETITASIILVNRLYFLLLINDNSGDNTS